MGTHPIFESDFDCLTEIQTNMMNTDELEFESDSEVGEDMDLDRIPEDHEEDSDEELRVAIATGLIQPGSKITISGQKNKRPDINNVEALQQKLNAIKNKLDWTERLDLTIEIPVENDEEGNPLIKDDFAREDHFQKVATEGARVGVIRSKRAGLPLLRPKDYFAEMAKSDEQMGKVKANLLSQKSKIEKRDKIRQMRQQKKFAKDVQKQAKVKKQEERKVAKEEIKMIKKKGEAGIVDFNKVKKEPMKRKFSKKEMKNAKYGFGGKKDKRNDAESHFGGPRKRGPGAKGVRKPQKRLGKSRRQAAK